MRKLTPVILETLERGGDCELVTVLEKQGSAPRGAGACMLVRRELPTLGTVGGGSVEREAEETARALLLAGGDAVRAYRIETGEAEDLGMICGGAVRILFQHLSSDGPARAVFRALAGKTENRLRRTVQGGAVVRTEAVTGTGRPRLTASDADAFVFEEPVTDGGRVLVFGGGHVAMQLVPVLTRIGFAVSVYDDRPPFVTKERFPDAEMRIAAPFCEARSRLAIGAEDWIVVMTRGHQADYEILTGMLRTDAGYIGCIGSRHKIEKTKSRLLSDGFTEADFQRIHTPIGLPIGAETPEEIAVSIAAELIQHRAAR